MSANHTLARVAWTDQSQNQIRSFASYVGMRERSVNYQTARSIYVARRRFASAVARRHVSVVQVVKTATNFNVASARLRRTIINIGPANIGSAKLGNAHEHCQAAERFAVFAT